jgi:uncharacterized membrane protein
MTKGLLKWFRIQINRTVESIAFLPAVMVLVFLAMSYLMINFDYSETGKQIKSDMDWLSLKDASTARTIISTIAGGIISLTVFSFSMVMIVLNQAASHLSNRILDKLIGNRFQQLVLGFYIGTIVYALFLLSTIREIDSGIYVPALSTYLLIVFTVFDINLFIYFLHYITQSVKYETIIFRIYHQTKESLEETCCLKELPQPNPAVPPGYQMLAPASGIFQGFDKNSLLRLCQDEDSVIYFLHPTETYVLKGTPVAMVAQEKQVPQDWEKQVLNTINIHRGENIDNNYFYGMRQLMEVAVKALSPGINDPGTAVLSLHALADLLAFRSQNFPEQALKDNEGRIRIFRAEKSFAEIFAVCILPIWDYGKNDRLVQQALLQILQQLHAQNPMPVVYNLLQAVQKTITQHTI